MKKSVLPFLLATGLALLAGCAALQGQNLTDEPVTDEGIAALANSRLNDDVMTGRATLSADVEDGLATLDKIIEENADANQESGGDGAPVNEVRITSATVDA